MASDLVNAATKEKLTEMDWAKNIQICELVAQDPRVATDVVKAIKKRLGNKNPNVQLYAVLLLEMLMNNLGEIVHRQVIDAALLPILVKIVKKKTNFPVRERIFLLLDATQTSVGGGSGKFPQYYNAYYELVSAGVQFPGRHHTVVTSNHPSPGVTQINLTVTERASGNQERSKPHTELRLTKEEQEHIPSDRNPSAVKPANLMVREVASADEESDIPGDEPWLREKKMEHDITPEHSIIHKASAALEVLREVLSTISVQNPEVANDEFTLDLVEQCSFHKQQVMQLAMSSRDERSVAQAIELNEQLEDTLARHDSLCLCWSPPNVVRPQDVDSQGNLFNRQNRLASDPPTSTSNHVDREAEEEEAEQLSRRLRKGKARASPEDEEDSAGKSLGLFSSKQVTDEKLHRPLMTLDPPSHEQKAASPASSIPPPPAKHIERERFFQEKRGDGNGLGGHMRGLSLHSRTSSSYSYNGSLDLGERSGQL